MGQRGNGAIRSRVAARLHAETRVRIASFTHWLIASLAIVIVSACTSSPAGPIQIALAESASGAVVRVTGLSSSELSGLQRAANNDDAWHALLRVTVSGADVPVAGRYVANGAALEFQPRFPLDPGRAYAVQFDPARLPDPRDAPVVTTTVRLAAAARVPSTVVTTLYPSADVWPENLLRFYIHFSAPMSRGSAVGIVRLVDDAGQEVADALLELDVDLWNDDHTRYTVFFDPGRVKRGIRPNVELGRALRSGRRYAIVIDAAWKDANGQPLKAAYRHEFRAGPPVEAALNPKDWRVEPPATGTRDPLVVTFPWPLDHGLLQRAVGVGRPGGGPLDGAIQVDPGERRWSFVPQAPWQRGHYELVVLTFLEDPSGNKVGRPFEIEAFERQAETPDAERQVLGFQIK
jgi:hypothetical protein